MPAHPVYGLGGEADVAHDRDLSAHDALDGGGHFAAPFALHRLCAAILDEADGVANRVLGADLVAAEGHVADHDRTTHAARDQAR